MTNNLFPPRFHVSYRMDNVKLNYSFHFILSLKSATVVQQITLLSYKWQLETDMSEERFILISIFIYFINLNSYNWFLNK